MKNTRSAVFCLLLVSAFSCNKPEAVLFEDRSTAIIANKSTWSATASSEELSGEGPINGRAATLIDGDITTFWHSPWSLVSNPVYPHWVRLDMKEEKSIISVVVTNRQGGNPRANGIKKFILEGSKDGTSFTKLGDYELAVSNAGQSFPVSPKEKYRYVKLTALEPRGTTTSTFLAEIDVVVSK